MVGSTYRLTSSAKAFTKYRIIQICCMGTGCSGRCEAHATLESTCLTDCSHGYFACLADFLVAKTAAAHTAGQIACATACCLSNCALTCMGSRTVRSSFSIMLLVLGEPWSILSSEHDNAFHLQFTGPCVVPFSLERENVILSTWLAQQSGQDFRIKQVSVLHRERWQ